MMFCLFLLVCSAVILFPSRAERTGDRILSMRRHPWLWTDDDWNDRDA